MVCVEADITLIIQNLCDNLDLSEYFIASNLHAVQYSINRKLILYK